jgi:hypothetical protein
MQLSPSSMINLVQTLPRWLSDDGAEETNRATKGRSAQLFIF